MQVRLELLPGQTPDQYNLLVKLEIGNTDIAHTAIFPLHQNMIYSLAKGIIVDFPHLIGALTEEGRKAFEKAKADALAQQQAQTETPAAAVETPAAAVPAEIPSEPASQTETPAEPLQAQN